MARNHSDDLLRRVVRLWAIQKVGTFVIAGLILIAAIYSPSAGALAVAGVVLFGLVSGAWFFVRMLTNR